MKQIARASVSEGLGKELYRKNPWYEDFIHGKAISILEVKAFLEMAEVLPVKTRRVRNSENFSEGSKSSAMISKISRNTLKSSVKVIFSSISWVQKYSKIHSKSNFFDLLRNLLKYLLWTFSLLRRFQKVLSLRFDPLALSGHSLNHCALSVENMLPSAKFETWALIGPAILSSTHKGVVCQRGLQQYRERAGYCFDSTVSEQRTHWVLRQTRWVLRETRWVRVYTQTIGWKELTELAPQNSVSPEKLTEFGVWNRTLRNRIRPVPDNSLHIPFGKSCSCPRASPLTPAFVLLAPQAPSPPSPPPTQPPNRSTQANALATPGANYPLATAWPYHTALPTPNRDLNHRLQIPNHIPQSFKFATIGDREPRTIPQKTFLVRWFCWGVVCKLSEPNKTFIKGKILTTPRFALAMLIVDLVGVVHGFRGLLQQVLVFSRRFCERKFLLLISTVTFIIQDRKNRDSQRRHRILRFFLAQKSGNLLHIFGAGSLLDCTDNLEKKKNIYWRKFKKFQRRNVPEIADFCPLSWSNSSWIMWWTWWPWPHPNQPRPSGNIYAFEVFINALLKPCSREV